MEKNKIQTKEFIEARSKFHQCRKIIELLGHKSEYYNNIYILKKFKVINDELERIYYLLNMDLTEGGPLKKDPEAIYILTQIFSIFIDIVDKSRDQCYARLTSSNNHPIFNFYDESPYVTYN